MLHILCPLWTGCPLSRISTVSLGVIRQLAEEIKRLADEGLLLQEIATRQNVNIATVAKSLKYWNESHDE